MLWTSRQQALTVVKKDFLHQDELHGTCGVGTLVRLGVKPNVIKS
jgi:hypothetical protein